MDLFVVIVLVIAKINNKQTIYLFNFIFKKNFLFFKKKMKNCTKTKGEFDETTNVNSMIPSTKTRPTIKKQDNYSVTIHPDAGPLFITEKWDDMDKSQREEVKALVASMINDLFPPDIILIN